MPTPTELDELVDRFLAEPLGAPTPLEEVVARARARSRRRRSQTLLAGACVVLVAVTAGALVAVSRRHSDHGVGVVATGPAPTVSSSAPAPSAAVTRTLVFSDYGRVQELNIDTGGGPTTLPLTWPASLGGPGAHLALSAPAVNRSHTQIAFVVGSLHTQDIGAIVVSDLDGSSARVLTNGPVNGTLAWSWDGSQIAFMRGDAIWIINADGTGAHALSLGVEASVVGWSPDGTTLAIQSVGEPVRMGTATIATGQVHWLTPADGSVEQFTLAWSPDGSHLVYGQRFAYATQPPGLFVANADGSDPRRLTTCESGCEDDSGPSWSSDGTTLAFVRYMNATPSAPQVYVVAASGGAVRQLTSGVPHDSPSW